MLENKKFGVISLGCDKNRVDTERMLGILKKNNYTICDDISLANIIIINTCAFLNASRQEAIDTIIECSEYKGGNLEKIVVTGCLAQKYIDEIYEGLPEVDVFLGINDYEKLLEAIENSYQNKRVNFVNSCDKLTVADRFLSTPNHYAYLKIADGCNNHCTYCLIPKIRGRYRSTEQEKLIAEAKSLGEVKELILVAQDTTRYGEDLYGENKFVELIQSLSKLENVKKIRLLYCYPDKISDKLINELKTNDKLLKYIDIPLQHSEDRVLKLMNRKGSREGYLSLINKLKTEIPEIAIRSTFICGFPSETEEDFNAMCKFLLEAKLFNCGFFEYSREEDTPAYKMANQIDEKIKAKRCKKLYAVQSKVSKQILKTFVGKTLEILCDGIDYENSRFVGRAYFNAPDIDGKVYFNAKNACQGEIYKVKILNSDSYDLFGETEDFNELT